MIWSVISWVVFFLTILHALMHRVFDEYLEMRYLKWPFLCLGVGVLFIPFGAEGTSVYYYFSGLQYQLSVITLAGCVGHFIRFRPSCVSLEGAAIFWPTNRLMWFALCSGCFLYPMALGLGPWDPYALGFDPWFFGSIMLLGAISFYLMYWELGVWIIVAGFAFILQLLESSNFWDYLIDPFAVLYSFFQLFSLFSKRFA